MRSIPTKWWPRHPFGRRLLLSLMALNLGVLVMAVWMAVSMREHHLSTARLVAQNYAQLAEQDVSEVLHEVDRLLANTASVYPKMSRDKPALARELIELQRGPSPLLGEIWVLDASGGTPVVTSLSATTRPWMQAAAQALWPTLVARKEPSLLLSKPLTGESQEAWVIVAARPWLDAQGQRIGAFMLPISLDRLSAAFRALGDRAQGTFTLLADDKSIVARYPERDARGLAAVGRTVATPTPTLDAMLATGQTEAQTRGVSVLDDAERFFSYRRVAGYGMSVVVGVNLAPYWAAWHFNLAILAALCSLFMLSTGVFGWRLFQAWQRREDVVQEVSELNARLDRETALNKTIIDSSPFAIYSRDRNGIVTAWNAAAEKLFGWSAQDAVGHPLFSVPADRLRETQELRERVLAGESVLDVELQRQRRDGSLFDLCTTMAPLRDPSGEISGYVSIAADVSARKAAERRVEFLAYRDVLTGLPNRQLLMDRFHQATFAADRQGSKVALLYLDLDNFKSINESLGHAVGDALLREVADRISGCVCEAVTISRQGGDEFLILIPDLAHAEAALPLMQQIREALLKPFVIGAHELTTSASIGVAIYSDDGRDFETLLKQADTAMYRAKAAGGNQHCYFNEHMNVEAVEYLKVKGGLRRALVQQEFVLHYQPQIEQTTGRVRGVEALLRWQHPDEGLLMPKRFIAIAEDSDLIVPVGEWVLREACTQAVAWRQAGLPPMVMAVNLSAAQFRRADLPQLLKQLLQETGCDPRLLELELTESVLIHDSEASLANVRQLKQLGVKLSIDDFGTGYSSLSYLKRFDVDKLKIDQSFVRDLARNPDDGAIVRAIIQLADSLGLRTVAEGVEDAAALAVLRELGCDDVQGYYFARPMEADAMADFLRRRHEEPLSTTVH